MILCHNNTMNAGAAVDQHLHRKVSHTSMDEQRPQRRARLSSQHEPIRQTAGAIQPDSTEPPPGSVSPGDEVVWKPAQKPVAAISASNNNKNKAVQFYDECYNEGVAGADVHRAAVESSQWETKWTTCRMGGAKNPSPDYAPPPTTQSSRPRSNNNKMKRTSTARVLLDSSSSSFSSDSPIRYPENPRIKRHAGVIPDDDDSSDDVSRRPKPVGPMQAPILRPIAVRAIRPAPPTTRSISPLQLPSTGDNKDDEFDAAFCMSPLQLDDHHQDEPSPLQLDDQQDGDAPAGDDYMTQDIRQDTTTTAHVSVVEPEEEYDRHVTFLHKNDSHPAMESLPQEPSTTLETAKTNVLHALAIAGGDVESPKFEQALLPLIEHYHAWNQDARYNMPHAPSVEGMWLTLSKPTYAGNLGETGTNGDPMYTLGRMSFDMFRPTQLVCSLQGNFNSMEQQQINMDDHDLEWCPKSLRDEISQGDVVLRTYNIITAFTIEPSSPDFNSSTANDEILRPIRGIMTTYGYALPDPQVPNRLSLWFTGGRLEPNDQVADQTEWKRFFGTPENLPDRVWSEKARVLAAKLLMGATVPTGMNPDDGSMEYEFTRPLGGHGMAYVDVIYLDNSMRIFRGHKGTVFCFARIH